jgi:hypothetical protein
MVAHRLTKMENVWIKDYSAFIHNIVIDDREALLFIYSNE